MIYCVIVRVDAVLSYAQDTCHVQFTTFDLYTGYVIAFYVIETHINGMYTYYIQI